MDAADLRPKIGALFEKFGCFVPNHFRRDGLLPAYADIGGLGPPPTPGGPEWLRDLVGDHYFCDVVGIHVSDNRVTNDVLKEISKQKNLRSLSLANSPKVSRTGHIDFAEFDLAKTGK